MADETKQQSSEDLAKLLVSWGSVSYAFGFFVVMLHTWRIDLPVIDLLQPIYVWVGLPIAIVAFLVRQFAAQIRTRASELAMEAKASWSLAIDPAQMSELDVVAELVGVFRSIGSVAGFELGDRPAKKIEQLIHKNFDQTVIQAIKANPEYFTKITLEFRRVVAVAKLFSAISNALRLLVYVALVCLALFFYVWQFYPEIPQSLGGGKERSVTLQVEALSIPSALLPVPVPAAAAGSATPGDKETVAMPATLLYMTKDAYYVEAVDGTRLSIKADSVKSAIWK